jgi:hypothetical protein
MKASGRTGQLKSGVAAGTLALAALIALPGPLGAQTLGVQANCTGTLPNGWTFAAEALDGRFLHIIWTGTEGQTRVSLLSRYSTNAEGFPVFQGTLQDALKIALVDRSGGTPATGTEVVVFSEDWGWFPGVCRQLGSNPPEGLLPTEVIRQSLVGTRDSTASNWLRRNGFTRLQIVTHSVDGKTERWQQDPSYPVDVLFSGILVSDVIPGSQ